MKMKIAVIVILLAHAAAIGTLLSTGGCQTSAPQVEPPPAPPLPPREEPLPAPAPATSLLRPPAPVKMDPERIAKAEPVTIEVQKGESLSQIAARHGLTTRELADLNAITDPNRLRVGQKLIIPGYAAGAVQLPKATSKPKAVSAPSPAKGAPVAAGATYVVKKGDTLSHIAVAHKVKIADLKAVNKMENDRIREGQKLTLPASAVSAPVASTPAAPVAIPEPAPAPATAPAPMVVPPETPEVVPPVPAEIPEPIVPPAPVAEPPAAPAAPTLGLPPVGEPMPNTSTFPYPTGAGDTLNSIAKNFALPDPEILKQLNPGVDFANLKPGTRIQVPLQP